MTAAADETPEARLLSAIRSGDAPALRGAGDAVTKLADRGRSALSLAASLGSVEVLQALLDEGAADVTAAGQAAFHGHADALKLLLATGGVEAATAPDPLTGLAPLMLSALKGHASCAAQLIDAAPDAIHTTDHLGRTVLMLAATGGSVETVRLLVERGAPVNATSNDGRTALIWAVIAHKARVVEALAQLGADPLLREKEPSELVKPGGPEAPKAALDHALQRHGKDPVLQHIVKYLEAWLEVREQGGEPPEMPEPAWESHAREVAAQEEVEPVAEVSTGGGGDAGDIWDDDDVEPAEVAQATEVAQAAEAAAEAAPSAGFTPSASFAGARAGQIFTTGPHGTGYYADPRGTVASSTAATPAGEIKAAEAPAAAVEKAKAPTAAPTSTKEALGLAGAQPLLLEPGDAPAAAPPSNLDELD